MTSQDALIKYFVETSGVTSPKLISEMLSIPYETARSWMRRYRMVVCNSTGEIKLPVESHRLNPTKSVELHRSASRAHKLSVENNTPLPPTEPAEVPQSVDDDDVKLKVQLINAVQNQPMNQFAASFDNIEPIRALIAEGFDLQHHILPTIRKHRYKGKGPINGWGYFATVVRNTHTAPNGKPKQVRWKMEEPKPGEFKSVYHCEEDAIATSH